jgi:hypothetical protein
MNKITITVNNGNSIELSFTTFGNLLVRHIDASGQETKRDSILQGDLVSLLNWYNYQKDNANEYLEF